MCKVPHSQRSKHSYGIYMLAQLKGVTIWSQEALSWGRAQGGCKLQTGFVLRPIGLVCAYSHECRAGKSNSYGPSFASFFLFFPLETDRNIWNWSDFCSNLINLVTTTRFNSKCFLNSIFYFQNTLRVTYKLLHPWFLLDCCTLRIYCRIL